MEIFKTINKNSQAEVTEKKSKFICNIYYVESACKAEQYIKEIKRKYNDSRHNVFAYKIQNEENEAIIKYSDDGEPQGTAGSPILKIINEKNLCNILIIVTRYFGGILLGKGGLMRAYSQSSIKALEECDIIEKELGYILKIEVGYTELEKIRHYLNKRKIKIINIQYLDNIEITVEINKEECYKITNNNNENNFKVLKCDILKEKNIDT